MDYSTENNGEEVTHLEVGEVGIDERGFVVQKAEELSSTVRVAGDSLVERLLQTLHARQIYIDHLKRAIKGISNCRTIAEIEIAQVVGRDGFNGKISRLLQKDSSRKTTLFKRNVVQVLQKQVIYS